MNCALTPSRGQTETEMKTLYFDLSMGAAGDMLAAALFQLVPEPERFRSGVMTTTATPPSRMNCADSS